MFTGTYTAIVTPFRNGAIDEAAFEHLVKLQIKGGVDGIVPVGTTGESPTVNVDEHVRLIEMAVKFSDGKLKIIAGAGANSTEEAISLTKRAAEVGAHATLQVAPYYNKPSQEGLFQHFRAIAKAAPKLPVILYSIPGRCGIEIGVDTVKRLVKACANIVGIKEAGGTTDRVCQLRATMSDRFVILSGDDSLTLPFMSVGAQGVISVASNIIPKDVSKMVKLASQGKFTAAQKIHFEYYRLFQDLFLETNPVPVKAALSIMKLIEEEYRLPLVAMEQKNRAILKSTMRGCSVIA